MRIFSAYILLLLCVYPLKAQDTVSTVLYGSSLDDRVEDAVLLPTGEVLVIGNSYSAGGSYRPFIFTIDSSLNIHDYSELYSDLSTQLRMIVIERYKLYFLSSFYD